MQKNKILSGKTIYQDRILSFTVNDVTLQDGSKGIRDILYLNGAVAILAIDPQDNLFLVRQYRHANSIELLELPAGMIDKDEDPLHAAKRELEEEIGYSAKEIEYLTTFYTSPGVVHEQIHLFLAKDLVQTHQHLDEDEFLSVEKYPLSQIDQMIMDHTISDGKTIIGYLFYKAYKK